MKYIDRLAEEREKKTFFKQYRQKWHHIFGKMTRKQEDELWKLWISSKK